MIEGKEAAFSFESFKVPKINYDQNNDLGGTIKISLTPSGVYDVSKGLYEISLYFTTQSDNNSNPKSNIFEVTSLAIFKFDAPVELDKIPEYFYQNAIAIMFPYTRAFISTLTLQANTKLLNLGLLNLSNLAIPLKENTKLVVSASE